MATAQLRSSGRPAINVSISEIEYLRSLRFSFTKIAEILGISRSTLYRRLDEEGIDRLPAYTDISDHDLDRALSQIKQSHPNDGERLMMGHLLQSGILVQRYRIRASIHRIDPIGTASRRSRTIRRRVYNVEGPNSLWHIDGNHKLIKWRFVIHGGIDGYTRTIVYLKCSTNNLAATVMSSFYEAVCAYGVPDKVRSDLGGENVDVLRYMVEQKQSESAVLVGSSTHNQRIERLWRDMYRSVGALYGNLFRQMEADDELNTLNEVDLYCLHFVFIPRINRDLDSFVESWNNHPLSTENNHTPNQLFVQGTLENDITLTSHVPNLATQQYSLPQVNDAVAVPRSSFTPCTRIEEDLEHINVLQHVTDFGYSLYKDVCDLVGNHFMSCNDCNV